MWDLPRPGIEPVSRASAGGFLTTAPPGKPLAHFQYALIFPRECSYSGNGGDAALLWDLPECPSREREQSRGGPAQTPARRQHTSAGTPVPPVIYSHF